MNDGAMAIGNPAAQLFAPARGEAPGRQRLAGRRIVVVGAGQRAGDARDTIGNGRAMSVLFAREGATVACVDKDSAACEETAARIGAENGNAIAIACDATVESQVADMLATAAAKLGGIDGVVVNVGIGNGLGVRNQTEEAWDAVLSLNLRAHMFVAKHAIDKMDLGSAFVFISSLASRLPLSRQPAYEASKAALPALCRAVALEGQSMGIRANVVSPGLIDTPMGRAASGRRPDRTARPLPFGRQGTGWEVAYAALFLLSHEASYVNGHDLFVDGGLLSSIVRAQ